MRKIVLTFGLIAGGILSASMLLAVPFQDAIGFDRGAIIGYTSMVLAFLMIYFGVRRYRDLAGGRVSFGRALSVGVMIAVVATVCYVASWQLVYYKLSPRFEDKYAAHAIEQARRAGASDAEIAARTKEMAQFKAMYANPLVNIAFTFLEPLPVGFLFALVSAGFLSRRRRESTPGRETVAAA